MVFRYFGIETEIFPFSGADSVKVESFEAETRLAAV